MMGQALKPRANMLIQERGVPNCEYCGLPVHEGRWVTKPPQTGHNVFKNRVHQRCRVIRAKERKIIG